MLETSFKIYSLLVFAASAHLLAQSVDVPTAQVVDPKAKPIVAEAVNVVEAEKVEQSQTLKEKDLSRDDVLSIQIYLDQINLGPGLVDGKMGKFTRESIAIFNRNRGYRESVLDKVLAEARKAVPEPLATAIVPKLAKNHVMPGLPKDREEQAKLKYLGYRSYGEFVAERYHTSERALIEFNSRKVVYNAKVGSALLVPNIEPFKIEDVKNAVFKKDELLSERTVLIDMQQKRLTIYDFNVMDNSGNITPVMVASFPITPGREEFIHRGEWKVKNCVALPTWRYDKQLLETGERGDEALQIPAGPNNPVGVIWAGLTKSGIGIHGTSDPQTIGRTVSAGCIRLANWEAVRLPELLRPGVAVAIR